MNQIVRRAIYLLAGAIPASLGVAFATFAEPWLIPAIAGAIGLLVASMVRFPVPLKGYGAIAILLIVGLSAAIPFGTTLLLLSLAAGVSAETVSYTHLDVYKRQGLARERDRVPAHNADARAR